MKCPECGAETFWRVESSGGDGLIMCPQCHWVEDVTNPIRQS